MPVGGLLGLSFNEDIQNCGIKEVETSMNLSGFLSQKLMLGHCSIAPSGIVFRRLFGDDVHQRVGV